MENRKAKQTKEGKKCIKGGRQKQNSGTILFIYDKGCNSNASVLDFLQPIEATIANRAEGWPIDPRE